MKNKAKLIDYIKIARPDHWIKHVFILPGIVLAYILVDKAEALLPWSLIPGFLSVCLLASANYVINEYCDAEFDKFHPIKKARPAVVKHLPTEIVYCEYFLLIIIGLFLAFQVSMYFFGTAIIFLIMALFYNIKPFRFKDRVFFDVLTESVNNPLRLLFGWFMVSKETTPPLSLIIFYFFGGAFLMATKRLAEYRFIVRRYKVEDLEKYRNSFKYYSENSLLVTSFLYGILASSFSAAFFIKHRNEFLFVFPLFAILFSYYFALSLRKTSIAQTPERLHKDKGLVLIVVVLVFLLIIFSFYDVPFAQKLIGIQEGINYNIWK